MPRRSSLAPLLLAYSLAFAAFLLVPPFLGFGRGLHADTTVADVFDLLTPLVLIPLSWAVFSRASPERPTATATTLFLVTAALWVLGHGIHLAANSISNLVDNAAATTPPTVRDLAHFYDEVLGHYLWHAGILGFGALVIRRAWEATFTATPVNAALPVVLLSAASYGFTLFLIVVEGGTVPLSLPASALLAAAGLWRWRAAHSLHPVIAMFVAAHALAVVLLLAWAIWQGGFPQFSDVGWV
jgi:hypothetical protein